MDINDLRTIALFLIVCFVAFMAWSIGRRSGYEKGKEIGIKSGYATREIMEVLK